MAHPDLDELLNVLLPFAQEMLAKHGEFFPFAGTMDGNGEIAHVAGYTGEEQPASQELIDLLRQGLSAQAARGELRAAGLCFDVLTIPPGESDKVDAICLELEHSSGESVKVFQPYRKRLLRGYRYGDLFAAAHTSAVFSPPSDDG